MGLLWLFSTLVSIMAGLILAYIRFQDNVGKQLVEIWQSEPMSESEIALQEQRQRELDAIFSL